MPGQDEATPTEAIKFEDWGGLNTKANRTAIAPNEFSWVENFMPIGAGNMRTLYAEDVAIYTATGILQIIFVYDYNLGADSFKAVFLDDGTADQVKLSDNSIIHISSTPGTFYPGDSAGLPACCQYQSKFLLIASPFDESGYWAWDGTSLFTNGTLAPDVTILNSGKDYTSAPTVTAYGGTGSGATFLATESDGRVVNIDVTNPGSGYLRDELVTLVITGGGSDDQARATATISATMGVAAVAVTAGGTGYTQDVSIAFSGGGGSGARAVISGAVNGVITEVTVTHPGTGYTSAPTAAFTGTGGAGATASVEMRNGMITAITVNSGGTGYTSPPSVVISAPDLPDFPIVQAEAYATITAGAVSAITVTLGGLGYSRASVDLSGGNDSAEAVVRLMPFGVAGGTIETYQGHVWISEDTKTTFSAPSSVSDFSTVNGGGSFPATDSFLRRKLVRLAQANGFLYLFGDSSINVISNVQTSGVPATTTFNNANIDPQVGTPWRDSLGAFGRALVFANSTGIYALYGGAAEKVSGPLDGLFATASFNTGEAGIEPSAAVVTLFGIRVYAFLFTTRDTYSDTLRDVMAMWDGKLWFIATQIVTPDAISGQEIDSELSAWGHDGTHVYKLFQVPDDGLTKVWQGKLLADHGYWVVTQVNQVAYVAQTNTSAVATLGISVDTETGTGLVTSREVSGSLQFVGSGPIQFTGLAGANLNFSAMNLVVDRYSEDGAYGRFFGPTVVTTAEDLTMISLALIKNEYAPSA